MSFELVQNSKQFIDRLEKFNYPVSVEQIKEALGLESDADLERLMQQIKMSKGHISICVHPFYNQTRPKTFTSLYGKRFIDFSLTPFTSFFEKYFNGSTKAPMILFDSIEDVKKDKPLFEYEFGKIPENLYFSTTIQSTGIPNFYGNDKNFKTTEERYSNLGNVLFTLGVKTITISGMYLKACLDDMYEGLRKKGFLVQYSRFVRGGGIAHKMGTLTKKDRDGLPKKEYGKKR
jgi:hypothetical protein